MATVKAPLDPIIATETSILVWPKAVISFLFRVSSTSLKRLLWVKVVLTFVQSYPRGVLQ